MSKQYLKNNKKVITVFLALLTCLFSNAALAWNHELAAGYGYGKEVEQDYDNSGYEITGKFFKFAPIDNTLIVTLDGTVAHWRSNTPDNNQLTIAAIAPNFRAYFFNPCYNKVRPYLGVSFGPSYLSQKQLGNREQGGHFAFQSTLEGGTEIALPNQHSLDLNLHLAHYCNAGLAKPNQGIDILYIVTVGYQF